MDQCDSPRQESTSRLPLLAMDRHRRRRSRIRLRSTSTHLRRRWTFRSLRTKRAHCRRSKWPKLVHPHHRHCGPKRSPPTRTRNGKTTSSKPVSSDRLHDPLTLVTVPCPELYSTTSNARRPKKTRTGSRSSTVPAHTPARPSRPYTQSSEGWSPRLRPN